MQRYQIGITSVFILLIDIIFYKYALGELQFHTYKFPIRMMWQVNQSISIENLAEFRILGINTIHSFALPTWSAETIKKYLEAANINGINVVAYIGNFAHYSSGKLEYEKESAEAFIRKWKDHPAILAWHIIDEPAKRYPKVFQEGIYEFVKSVDPEKPIILSFNGGPIYQWREYFTEEAFDILDIHRYPNPGLDREELLIKNFMKFRKRKYPVISTLRSFNGPNWVDLPIGSIREQFELFKKYNLAYNFAFYGWDLSPNIGLNRLPEMYDEVKIILNEMPPLPPANLNLQSWPQNFDQ